jgi:hypothetical protein
MKRTYKLTKTKVPKRGQSENALEMVYETVY